MSILRKGQRNDAFPDQSMFYSGFVFERLLYKRNLLFIRGQNILSVLRKFVLEK